jgi:hypothetical protein
MMMLRNALWVALLALGLSCREPPPRATMETRLIHCDARAWVCDGDPAVLLECLDGSPVERNPYVPPEAFDRPICGRIPVNEDGTGLDGEALREHGQEECELLYCGTCNLWERVCEDCEVTFLRWGDAGSCPIDGWDGRLGT